MEELIAQLTQRVGLTPDQARQATELVIGFLKTRLPAPLASHLDQLTGTGGDSAGTSSGTANIGLGDLTKGLGGLLGG